VEVASAGPYASLHHAANRKPCQHPTTQFFTDWMPFLPPNQQRQSTEGKLTTMSNVTKSQEEQRARLTNKLIFDGFHDFSIFQFKTLRKTSQQLRTQLLTVTCHTLQ